MGGDLTGGQAGRALKFLMRAVKDPDGANLDRVQVIKGWRDRTGELFERVYDVAWSGERTIDEHGVLEDVQSTVDLATATYANTTGAPELAATWADPDFDPGETAFYYVRVIAIPAPRWTAYAAAFYGLGELPASVPSITRERKPTRRPFGIHPDRRNGHQVYYMPGSGNSMEQPTVRPALLLSGNREQLWERGPLARIPGARAWRRGCGPAARAPPDDQRRVLFPVR